MQDIDKRKYKTYPDMLQLSTIRPTQGRGGGDSLDNRLSEGKGKLYPQCRLTAGGASTGAPMRILPGKFQQQGGREEEGALQTSDR